MRVGPALEKTVNTYVHWAGKKNWSAVCAALPHSTPLPTCRPQETARAGCAAHRWVALFYSPEEELHELLLASSSSSPPRHPPPSASAAVSLAGAH